MSDTTRKLALILGGGINGAAIARELALNGVSVILVDQADLAGGATAYSSRLIHGGLRYLEHGDFALVRESLEERTRLLTLAPHLVRPLRLHIPVENRFGGLRQSMRRFFRFSGGKHVSRGVYLVRIGLWLYDQFAKSSLLPKRSFQKVGAVGSPAVDAQRYHWVCQYSDAQIRYPERMVIAMLEDARRLAADSGAQFEVLPYAKAERSGAEVRIESLRNESPRTIQPDVIINATGAWVDATLDKMQVDSKTLMGPTKGSHLLTFRQDLIDLLNGAGVYSEAEDGRPVFLLPFEGGVLIGTTDLHFSGDPADAVATEEEIEYLCSVVSRVFPQVSLARDDVSLHYAGVRPLPQVDKKKGRAAAIPRGHWLKEHPGEPPLLSIIGGKLTTCRALAEEATDKLLSQWNMSSITSQDRLIPGGEPSPTQQDIAAETDLPQPMVEAVYGLCGSLAGEYLTNLSPSDRQPLTDTQLPKGFVRRVIEREWASSVSDLVERRLMLLYSPHLSTATLRDLADILIEVRRLSPEEATQQITEAETRLRERFGKTV